MTHKGKEKRGQGWRRALVFLMTLVLICGLAAPVYAEQTEGNTEPATQTTEASTETTVSTEETTASTVLTMVSAEETMASTEETTASTEETTASTEEATVSAEETTASTEETTAPAEETTAPTEGEAAEKPLYDRLMAAESCNAMLTLIQENAEAFKAMTPTAAEKEKLETKVAQLPVDESTETVKEKIGGLKTKDETPGDENADTPEAGVDKKPSLVEKISDALGLGDMSPQVFADTRAIGGQNSITIAVDDTETISSWYSGYYYSEHSWTSDNESVATVHGSGSSATVTGKGGGTATITHKFNYNRNQYSETITVTVTGPEANRQAAVYFLATPTSNADSNAISQWGTGIASATVNMTGASWTNDNDGYPKNVFNRNDHLAQYILSWPDGSTGATWTITPDKYPNAFQEVYNAYKTSLENQYGITGLQLSDLTEITLTPHKISQNNGGDYPTHIDCTIDIKCNIAYTVKYWVQEPGDSGYTNVYNENKAIHNSQPDSISKYSYPETKTVAGVIYEFDGWYNEANQKVSDDAGWPYTPNETELADGTVNFYAHYTVKPASLTIEKAFTGLASDTGKPDAISVTVTGNDGSTKTVTLNAPGYTATLNDLDPRVEYTVAEDQSSARITNYNLTSVAYSSDGGKITPNQDGTSKVVITNTYTPQNTTLTVKKLVTGGLGDKTKNFNFTVKYGGEIKDTFVLSNNGERTITDIPIGTVVTIEEDDYAGNGYSTSFTGVAEGTGRTATWTAEAGDSNTITFTNFKDASPDTGVLLDSLPYILILAAVVLAVALMLVLKRRRADD